MLNNYTAGREDCTPTQLGHDYIGHIAVTASGRECQAWSVQSPHSHSYTDDSKFIDGSAEAASNYCRNPGNEDSSLWCYTADPSQRWEYCDIPICDSSSSGQSF